jgi:hypothetical protein
LAYDICPPDDEIRRIKIAPLREGDHDVPEPPSQVISDLLFGERIFDEGKYRIEVVIVQPRLERSETGIIKGLVLFRVKLFHRADNQMRLPLEGQFILDFMDVFHVDDVNRGRSQQKSSHHHRVEKRVFDRVAVIVQ